MDSEKYVMPVASSVVITLVSPAYVDWPSSPMISLTSALYAVKWPFASHVILPYVSFAFAFLTVKFAQSKTLLAPVANSYVAFKTKAFVPGAMFLPYSIN